MNAPQQAPGDNDRDTTLAPTPCPTCHGARTWEIDPSDSGAGWFRWCGHCAIGEFPSEDDE